MHGPYIYMWLNFGYILRSSNVAFAGESTRQLGKSLNWGICQPATFHLVQSGAPLTAKLVYNSNNYGLWMFMVFIYN